MTVAVVGGYLKAPPRHVAALPGNGVTMLTLSSFASTPRATLGRRVAVQSTPLKPPQVQVVGSPLATDRTSITPPYQPVARAASVSRAAASRADSRAGASISAPCNTGAGTPVMPVTPHPPPPQCSAATPSSAAEATWSPVPGQAPHSRVPCRTPTPATPRSPTTRMTVGVPAAWSHGPCCLDDALLLARSTTPAPGAEQGGSSPCRVRGSADCAGQQVGMSVSLAAACATPRHQTRVVRAPPAVALPSTPLATPRGSCRSGSGQSATVSGGASEGSGALQGYSPQMPMSVVASPAAGYRPPPSPRLVSAPCAPFPVGAATLTATLACAHVATAMQRCRAGNGYTYARSEAPNGTSPGLKAPGLQTPVLPAPVHAAPVGSPTSGAASAPCNIDRACADADDEDLSDAGSKLYDEEWWYNHLEERRQGGAPPDRMAVSDCR